MRIRIKDFQAIKDALLEVKGITFLTGLNNQGKSSIIRAVNAAVVGRAGSDHVRHGAKFAMVGIEMEEGPDHSAVQLAWIKGSGGSEYFINGKEFTKLGRRGVPSEDLEKVGLRDIEFSGGRHCLMFDLQDDPHFLVALPPTQVFDYVSKVLQERHILPVIKTMAGDAKELRTEAVQLEGEIQTRKGSIQTWEEEKRALSRITSREDDFLRLRQEVVTLRRTKEVKEKLNQVIAEAVDKDLAISSREKFLEDAVPKLAKYEAEAERLEDLRDTRIRLARVEQSLVTTKEALAEVPDVSRAPAILQELETAWAAEDQMKDTRTRLARVEDSLAFIDAELKLFPDLDAASTQFTRLEEETSSLVRMRDLRDRVTAVDSQKEKLAKDIKSAEGRLDVAEDEFHDLKNVIGICPVCESKIGD